MTVLWSIRDVSMVTGKTRRLDDVTAEIPDGVTAVLGYSGAGKTSLLNLLVDFESASTGTIKSLLPNAAVPIFWVPQNGGLWNHLTVRDHIDQSASGSVSATDWLARFDLESRRTAFPAELSQGERARLSVARALSTQAPVLVMDEPLAHVDPGRMAGYFDVIAECTRAPARSLVFATHQPDLVLRYAQNVICLDAGTCVFAGSVRDLYEKPANSRLGTLLGPGNWISKDEFRLWLDQVDHAEGVIRPERLRICESVKQRFAVVGSRSLGVITETTLRDAGSDQEHKFVHSTGASLGPGLWVDLLVQQEECPDGDE